MEYLEKLIQQGNFIGASVFLILSAVIWIGFIAAQILIIKYVIRYGINYYFKKLEAYEMDMRLNDLDLEIKTHHDD